MTEQFDKRLRLEQQQSEAAPTREQSASGYSQETNQPAVGTGGSYDLNQLKRIDKQKENYKNADRDDDDGGDSNFGSDSDDDDYDDPALEAFRKRRLEELRKAQTKDAENKAKGHGEVRTIAQDEFLPECTGSDYVAVHFFHEEFERCKIMDHHLKLIAPQHLSCKFIRIDAEKAPFFVVKLKVQTLPTLILFKDGKTIDRLVGFEDIADATSKDPDNFPTSRLGYWLERRGAIEYEGPDSDDEEAPRRSTPNGVNRVIAYDEDV